MLLEFEAGFDGDQALADPCARRSTAPGNELPRDAGRNRRWRRSNLSLFSPVLVVALGRDLPERTLLRLARDAEAAIEQVPGVLTADMKGSRDEVVEVIAEPMLLRSYGLDLDTVIAAFGAGNSLVAAGALEGESGRFAVKVPALFETPEDILAFPIAASGNAVVTLADVAQVRPTFKDAESITRINGKPAIVLEVSKRTGANLIETVDAVKETVRALQATWPGTLEVTFTQDKSSDIRTMLHDLQNSVVTAVLLVVVIMLYTLGARASLFIGIAIPGAFLAGILGLYLAGLTVNIVVLFSLILAVGMLVDDAIIVSEFAERRMAEGMPAPQAYSLAAKRMAGPVIASTATRIAAFSPLLFWPGIVGEFMMYMPITLIATLTASLVIALIFTPTLGALLAKPPKETHAEGALPQRGPLHGAHPGRDEAPAGDDRAHDRAARLRRAELRALRQRRRVLPRRGAGIRPRPGPCPRQPRDRREGRAGALRRGAAAGHGGARDGLRPRRRGGPRLPGGDRGHDRHDPVRARRLARPAHGLPRSWPTSAGAPPTSRARSSR